MNKAYIIAEMAWSHTGSLDRALEMLEGAKKAGADAISIHITDMQTYMVEGYKCLDGVTLSVSADSEQSIYKYLDDINLSNEQWIEFDKQAKSLGIDLVVMCNDHASLKFSKRLNVHNYVLSASSFLETDLIEEIVKSNSDIILRTGGATLIEIDEVVTQILMIDPKAKITLLAGIQLYPTPIEDLHLKSLRSIEEHFKQKAEIVMGLADHIDGDHKYAMHLPVLALSYGAKVLEKHITIDRKDKLEDFEAALGIDQFFDFVDLIRTAETAIGDGSLDYMVDSGSYHKYRLVSRKKVIAATNIPSGTILTKEMLNFKRADNGSQLSELNKIIGSTLTEDKIIDQGIDLSDVKILDSAKI
jgi:N,N'-diacetyllegionaminate synthase